MGSFRFFGLSDSLILLLLAIEDGATQFEILHERTGLARNIITDLLNGNVRQGVLEKVPYSDTPRRFEYRLSTKGRDLMEIIHMYLEWLTKYGPDDGDDGLAGVPAIVR